MPKESSPLLTRRRSGTAACLLVIGGLVLLAAILIPFLARPSEFDGFVSSQGNFVKDLYVGRLVADPSYSQAEQSKPSLDELLLSLDREEELEDDVGQDDFAARPQNTMTRVKEEPVSTFSADVDTASYSYVRRKLNKGRLPQADAVMAEEMINYFDYDYPLPRSKDQPLEPIVGVSDSPWNEGRRLIHIGIAGYDLLPSEERRSNLVFLIDVSGSMGFDENRLPLVKKSIELLLDTLDPEDHVSIVSYSYDARVELNPTLLRNREKILKVLHGLKAGGGTGGAGGLELAYKLAERHFDDGGVNRILLASDGDFNVGVTDNDMLQSFIEKKRDKGIYLSVLGFGLDNYKDSRMKVLANHGNGVAAYIDTIHEAQKVLVDESRSTIFPIANDVKLQVEFNPATVSEYRLIGFEKRLLHREDFNNDKVDAGDIGSGHTVTAIYEITPVGSDSKLLDELRYSPAKDSPSEGLPTNESDEYAFIKIRYKLPDEKESNLLTVPISPDDVIPARATNEERTSAQAFRGRAMSEDLAKQEFGFATAVASFAQLLKGGKHMGSFGYDDVVALAEKTKGEDVFGYRQEFIELVLKAKGLAKRDFN